MNSIKSSDKIIIAVAVLLIGLTGTQAGASSATAWINPAGGAFDDPANWVGGVAGPSKRAVFQASGSPTYTVTFSGNVYTQDMTVCRDNDVTFDLNGYEYHVADRAEAGGDELCWDWWVANHGGWSTGDLTVTDGLLGTVYFGIGQGSSLTVSNGGLVDVAGDLRVDGTLTMNSGGNLQVGRLALYEGRLTGTGTVSAPVYGLATSTITASGGDLTLGDAARFDGFLMDGTIAVGSHTLTLNTQSFATVGLLTTIDGGSLQADNGVFIQGGGTIVGYGSVDAPIAAAIGSTISASGDLVLGDAMRYDGFFSDGVLHVNAHTVTLHDHNEAVLGSLTTIGGGTLAAPNSFLVLEGRNLTGRGFVAGNFKNQGSVIGDGTAANERIIFDSPWVVSGKGTFVNTLILGTFAPGESPAVVTGTNQGFGGIVQIELGGTQPGFGDDKHDQIVDTGTILLWGSSTLEVLPWDGFIPQIGDEFTFLTWETALDGVFGNVLVDPWFKTHGIGFGLSYNNVAGAGELILGAAFLGDLDWDGDVDADDIDILCGNMGDPTYDLDGDFDADENDLIYLVENLVEWDNGVDAGVGTKQGDFNLDGVINATDLAIMKIGFGQSALDYADGNANCDDVINATDLAILKTNYAFEAPTGQAVPEPATLGLLALSGLALLKRRRK